MGFWNHALTLICGACSVEVELIMLTGDRLISVLPVPVMSLDQRGVVVDAKDVRHCPRCPADIEIPSVQHFPCNTLGRGELFPARIQLLRDSSLFAICRLNCDVEVASIVPRTGRTNRMQATARSGLFVFHKVICLPSPDPKRSASPCDSPGDAKASKLRVPAPKSDFGAPFQRPCPHCESVGSCVHVVDVEVA